MSNPSFSNIDRWFFDYVEGNLSPEQINKLESFIASHPELEFDLDTWKASKLEPIEMEFPDIDNLYRKERTKPAAFYWLTGVSLSLFVITLLVFGLNFNNTPDTKNKSLAVFSDKSFLNSPSVSASYNTNKPKENDLNLNDKLFIKNLKAPAVNYFDNNKNSSIVTLNVNNPNPSKGKELNNSTAIVESPDKEVSLMLTSLDPLEIDFLAKQKNQKILRTNTVSKKDSKRKFRLPRVLSKSLRKINRFMEKDLALNNTRNHNVHLPGLTHLDANYSSAGDVSSTRFKSITRAQWIGKENQKLSNSFSLDTYSKVLRSGFGFQFDYSHYGNGVIQDWNTSLIYSPKIALSRSFLIEPAVRFKMGNKYLNASKVEPGHVEWDRNNIQDFYTTGLPVGNKLWYRDLGVSLLMHAKWIYIGVQADNLLRHVDNIYSNNIDSPQRAANHYIVYFGSDYDIPSIDMAFSPYFVYDKQAEREESWGGINMSYKKLTFGGAVSSSRNFAASLGFSFNRFAFTYQFDRTYSSLLLSQSNSHQLSLLINSQLRRSSRRYITL